MKCITFHENYLDFFFQNLIELFIQKLSTRVKHLFSLILK